MSAGDELALGDEVAIPYGFQDLRGTVTEIYGPPGRRHVLILLKRDPEFSDDQPTTVSMPVDEVRKVSIT
jgi:hypothetical protein